MKSWSAEQGTSLSFLWGANSAKPLGRSRQDISHWEGGHVAKFPLCQNFDTYQCDLGQVTYFLPLSFLISKMEIRKSDLLARVVVHYKCGVSSVIHSGWCSEWQKTCRYVRPFLSSKSLQWEIWSINKHKRDFHVSPVVKPLSFHCREQGFIPGWTILVELRSCLPCGVAKYINN